MKLNMNILRTLLFSACLFLSLLSNAQLNIYVVKFKDKNNSPYSINRPGEFLSQKSLDRRQRQHIAITTEDLPVNPSYKAVITSKAIKIRLELKWFNSIVVQTTADNVPYLQGLNFVESVESLGPIPSQLQATIKPFFRNETTDQLNFKAAQTIGNYGPATAQIEQVKGQLLHGMGLKGQGMTIAVLDAGFRNLYTLAVFDSLRLKGRLKGVRDFTYMPNFLNGSDEAHGTEVLSVMAGWINNVQIGTAPNADYYLLRTEDATSESPVEPYNWAAGAAYADSVGADIISSSLGYYNFDTPYTGHNYTYSNLNGHTTIATRAAAKAANRGILVVNAAGNEGGTNWQHIIAPADADTLLAIGAVNTFGVAASFTSTGPSFDGRVKPDIAACGEGTTIANPNGNSLITGNGTSFATPLVAGLCACLWQGYQAATNQDIINALRFTASQSISPDNVLGFGIASFYKAYTLLKKQQFNTASDKPVYMISANPFPDRLELIITTPSTAGWMVDVYTVQGKLVERYANIASNRPLLVGSKIKSGIYILRIISGNKIAIEKIIKN